MMFVNKERIRYNPKELHHGDHILFGTRHIFQYINPMETASLALDADEKKQSARQQSAKSAFEAEADKHKKVGSIFDMKSLMIARMQTNEFRVGNADITPIQAELVKKRQEAVAGGGDAGDSTRRLRDSFMEDYRIMTAKCSNANQMSLKLEKQVLFDVGT